MPSGCAGRCGLLGGWISFGLRRAVGLVRVPVGPAVRVDLRQGEACHRAVELVPVWPAVRLDLRPGGACHQAGACGVVACRRLDLRRAASAVGVLRVAVPSGLGVISAGMRRKAPHLFPHRFACFS